MNDSKNSQIKSKERVAERGEVFTNEREVKAMCDLVKDETERIDSRFLEPACGNGNFLAEILTRKLAVVEKTYGKNLADYEKYSLVAVSSIYGVDIMADNAEECRERMLSIWESAYKKVFKSSPTFNECKTAAAFILSRNILCGDALTLLDDKGEPIVFSEWSLVGNNVKRRDFTLANLLQTQSYYELPLFEDVEDVAIPRPVREFAPIHFRKVYQDE